MGLSTTDFLVGASGPVGIAVGSWPQRTIAARPAGKIAASHCQGSQLRVPGAGVAPTLSAREWRNPAAGAGFGWSLLRESNSRPFPYHGNALPTELRRLVAHERGGWCPVGHLEVCHGQQNPPTSFDRFRR